MTGLRRFRKVLVANRGEIAVRICRGLRDQGITSVAVYSDADRTALHVRAADEAYRLGPAPAGESYLDIERVLAAARASGADAVHPGYGFLSEDARFARAVGDAGLVWIGPPPEAMERLGNKLSARAAADEAGVPTVPGSPPLGDDAAAESEADRIGYPLLVKASAGGGGKGMRVVREAKELTSALRAARSESKVSFGDDTIYLERLVSGPRHIEIQLLGDMHGNVVYLGERECSVQRRHQKVLEESPSVALTADTRKAMGEAAVRAARAAGYYNAGTAEFLLGDDGSYYFLEVNARLQVEHPVTEMCTGLDLVALQIHVAAGGVLPFTQDQITSRGHAIEVRVYAEDPDHGYLPSPGPVKLLREPSGPGVRVDSGIAEGFLVTPNYDPILAKLIVWGGDREQAIARLRRALFEYRIGGLVTNLSLFPRILNDERFLSGDYDTSFLESLEPMPEQPELSAAAALGALLLRARPAHGAVAATTALDPAPCGEWKRLGRQRQLRDG